MALQALSFYLLVSMFTRCDLKLQKFLSLHNNVWVFFFFIDQMFIIERRRFCYYANGLFTTLETKQNNKQIK